MLSTAKTEVDYEVAQREQRALNEAFFERQRALEAAEWESLQFAQRLEQEEKDEMVAAQMGAAELKDLERMKQARARLLQQDERAAKQMLAAEQAEVQRLKRSLAGATAQDSAFAQRLQLEEQRIAREQALKATQDEEARLRTANWIKPVVYCQEDPAHECMRVHVDLPGLGQTDVVVTPEADRRATISIAALSKCGTKTFAFNLTLESDESIAITPAHVRAQYDEPSGRLEICVTGIKLNPKQETSIMDRIKNFFA
jgi:hypothetical protein